MFPLLRINFIKFLVCIYSFVISFMVHAMAGACITESSFHHMPDEITALSNEFHNLSHTPLIHFDKNKQLLKTQSTLIISHSFMGNIIGNIIRYEHGWTTIEYYENTVKKFLHIEDETTRQLIITNADTSPGTFINHNLFYVCDKESINFYQLPDTNVDQDQFRWTTYRIPIMPLQGTPMAIGEGKLLALPKNKTLSTQTSVPYFALFKTIDIKSLLIEDYSKETSISENSPFFITYQLQNFIRPHVRAHIRCALSDHSLAFLALTPYEELFKQHIIAAALQIFNLKGELMEVINWNFLRNHSKKIFINQLVWLGNYKIGLQINLENEHEQYDGYAVIIHCQNKSIIESKIEKNNSNKNLHLIAQKLFPINDSYVACVSITQPDKSKPHYSIDIAIYDDFKLIFQTKEKLPDITLKTHFSILSCTATADSILCTIYAKNCANDAYEYDVKIKKEVKFDLSL